MAELLRHFKSDDEWLGDLMGILTGTATAKFDGIGEVEFELTDKERAEYLSAIVKSRASWFGFSIAHYMSEELDMLMSGHMLGRYRILEAA